MVRHYLGALAVHSQRVTCQLGMEAYQEDGGWGITYADLVRVARQFPRHVRPLTPLVSALTVRP